MVHLRKYYSVTYYPSTKTIDTKKYKEQFIILYSFFSSGLTIKISIWGRGRRIGSPAGSVYSGERASHWPATPPCWTCRPTSGSPGTATVPEAAPSVFRVLGLRDVLRPLPSPPALLIRAEEGY